jgi:hypothetical protein
MLSVITLISAAVVPPAGADSRPDAQAAFERLKQLVGAWRSPAGDAKSAVTRFELLAGGSAILERYSDRTSAPATRW